MQTNIILKVIWTVFSFSHPRHRIQSTHLFL